VPVEGAGAGEAVGAKLVCGGQARALEHKALGRSKNGDRWHVEAARDGRIFREEKMWPPQHWPIFFLDVGQGARGDSHRTTYKGMNHVNHL
jgi:hypothetical protein